MRRRAPVSTPLGMRSVNLRGVRTCPDPRHVGQGFSMTVPEPPQAGHVWRTWKNPPPLITCPRPLHVGHVLRELPRAAPVPWQSWHWSGRVRLSSRSLPKTASSKSISSSMVMSSPRSGALGSARRRPPPPKKSPNPPNLPPPPKNAPSMSPRSTSWKCEKSRPKSKPPGPKFTP